MTKIGLLGGTFNPVHNGHLHLANAFLKGLGLDRVVFIPVKSPPHKAAAGLIPAGHRLAMLRIAAAGKPYLDVSDIEVRRGGVSYTVDTLKAFAAESGGGKLYFLTGSDMFLTLENWRSFKEIAGLAALCACARHEGEYDRLAAYAERLGALYGAECHIVDIPPVEISSTVIRGLLAGGGDASAMLPEGVYEYIKEHRLYRAAG